MKPAIRALLDDGHPGVDRRSFCKRLGIGAGAAIAMTGEAAAAAAADFVQSNVNRSSEPSALKISLMASVHTAAATENFMALEHHSLDVPWWNSMVTVHGGGSLFDQGFAVPPNAPGLGLDVNLEVVKQHLRPNSGLFLPTPEWDSVPSNDRPWS
jgi:hypothetical protein